MPKLQNLSCEQVRKNLFYVIFFHVFMPYFVVLILWPELRIYSQEVCFLIYLKLSFMSSGDKPILTLKIDRKIRTGTIFNQREPSCKKKELHVNSTLNTFQGKYVNFG